MAATHKPNTQHAREEAAIINNLVRKHPVPVIDDHCYDYEVEQNKATRRNDSPQVLYL